MPLQIIGAGFGGTGTESLYTALNELGLPCYHMVEILHKWANRSHADFWLKVANAAPGTQQDWETEVFSRYAATVDNPSCVVWRELVAAYPEAKVILTLHPKGAEAWYESTMDTVYFTETMWQYKLLEAIVPFARKMGAVAEKLMWGRGHEGTMTDRAKAIAFYERHARTVIAAVPPERLLVFKATEGWAPLCAFLSIPVPATPFPNVNSREAFQKIKRKVAWVAYAFLGVGAMGVAGAVYGVLQL